MQPSCFVTDGKEELMQTSKNHFEAKVIFNDETIRRMFRTEFYTYEGMQRLVWLAVAFALVMLALFVPIPTVVKVLCLLVGCAMFAMPDFLSRVAAEGVIMQRGGAESTVSCRINAGGVDVENGAHIPFDQIDRLVDFLNQIGRRHGVQVYLEPGEAVALDAGVLVGEILDVFDNGMPIGITDISATCHMPDVIEAPYRPAMLNEAEGGVTLRLGGPSCLAGDIIGDYVFTERPTPGTRIAFLDQAHYSMVKTNTFNGVPLPAIALWNSDTDSLKLIREFDYRDFRDRLS